MAFTFNPFTGNFDYYVPSTSYSADESTLHLSSTIFSIKSTYVGQTSITTLGTVSTGVWNGTRLTSSYIPTDVAYTDVANTFTVAPQTLISDSDSNKNLILKRHSGSATANLLEAQDQNGVLLACIDPTNSPNITPIATAGGRYHAYLTGAGYGLSFYAATTPAVYGGLYIATGGGVQYGTESASAVQLFTNNINRFKILSTGEVIVAYGIATNSLNSGSPASGFPLTLLINDSATTTVTPVLALQHNSTSNAAAGFGESIVWYLDSPTTYSRLAAEDQTTWATATDASRKGRRIIGVHDASSSAGSPREGLRIESNGTLALVSVGGAVDTAARFTAQTSTALSALKALDTAGSCTYVAEFHALNQSPFLCGFFNDAYSSTVPAFEYFAFTAGTFWMGTGAAKAFGMGINNHYTNPELTISTNGYVTIVPTGVGQGYADIGAQLGVITNSTNTALIVKDNLGTCSYIVEAHAKGQFPFVAAFFNDTYSSSTPAFEYFAYNNGNFWMGTGSATNLGIGINNDYTNPALVLDSNKFFTVFNGGSNGYGNLLSAPFGVLPRYSATTTLSLVNALGCASSGTPGAGFGGYTLRALQSSTTANQLAAEQQWLWATATHASRKGRWVAGVHDAGSSAGSPRVGLSMASSGSAALLQLFGTGSEVAQSTGWAVSNVSSDKVFDANATSIDELADVLGTLITYLISLGALAA